MRYLVLFLFLMPCVYGASISGIVYDLSLDLVDDAIVTVDTEPEQRVVAKDGSYAFNVPAGSYSLIAKATIDKEAWMVYETITVSEDGAYVLDLILEPQLAEEELFFDVEAPVVDIRDTRALNIAMMIIGVMAIFAVAMYYNRKLGSDADVLDVAEDEYKKAVLKVLKQNKKRMTQRELRKALPFSEAKVSLVITELEAEGKVKKIKKGRGNVIVKI